MAEDRTNNSAADGSMSKHRKQVFWQIIFPLILAIGVILFVAVVAAQSTLQASAAGANPASTAAIFLITPLLGIGLVFLALLILFVVGVTRAKNGLPGFAGRVLGYFVYAQRIITQASNQSVQPILSINSRIAAIKRFFQKVSGK